MDRRVLDYLISRSEQDSRDERRRRNKRTGRYMRDRADRDDYREDYEDRGDREDYEDYEDSRRRDRRSGGRDRRDRRDRRDSRDYEDSRDYGDYEDSRDYEDGHYEMRLKKSDMKEWKRRMENADGTKGEHFDMQQILQIAERLNIKFRDFDEKEFCLAVNMMYSDYCKVLKRHVSEDKELIICAELAKAFLEDQDGPEPSEKLALYYYCIVNYEPV